MVHIVTLKSNRDNNSTTISLRFSFHTSVCVGSDYQHHPLLYLALIHSSHCSIPRALQYASNRQEFRQGWSPEGVLLDMLVGWWRQTGIAPGPPSDTLDPPCMGNVRARCTDRQTDLL